MGDRNQPIPVTSDPTPLKPTQPRQNIAEQSLPVRVIFPEFENGIQPECILDGGAEAIVMRRDVWKRLDRPLLTEKTVIMKATNTTQTHTLGIVKNVRMALGPISSKLQIQVVEDAPFEVLLGRPFFAHTNCITEDTPNGSSFITLRDPNTGEVAKFITYPRRLRPPAAPSHISLPL
jgi:Aspartyl protease